MRAVSVSSRLLGLGEIRGPAGVGYRAISKGYYLVVPPSTPRLSPVSTPAVPCLDPFCLSRF